MVSSSPLPYLYVHCIGSSADCVKAQILFLHFLYYYFIMLDFKSSCVIKNRRKASNIKVLKFIDQNSALGCLSDQRLTKKQHQGNISQSIYRYVSTCVIFSLAARTVQRSPNILLPLFPLCPWYRMFSQCVLLCFSFFKLPLCDFSLHTRLLTHYVTLHSTMYQKTHQLQLIALYSQQAL